MAARIVPAMRRAYPGREEAEVLAAEANRISRATAGVSVRRTIDLEDASSRAVTREHGNCHL
jgi:hypothetical protein